MFLYVLIIRMRFVVTICLGRGMEAIFGIVLANLVPDGKLVVIDPSHGGIDGGTSRGNLRKGCQSRMGHILRKVLERHQYQVIMTRTDDSDVTEFVPPGGSRYQRDLKGRVKLVGRVQPCSLISIHVNWHRDTWRRGAIVYYQEGEISGRLLAELIQKELNLLQETQRQARSANFYVLRNTNTPAVLVELGFISNPDDQKRMLDDIWLTRQAEAIRAGLEAFLKQSDCLPQAPKYRRQDPAKSAGSP